MGKRGVYKLGAVTTGFFTILIIVFFILLPLISARINNQTSEQVLADRISASLRSINSRAFLDTISKSFARIRFGSSPIEAFLIKDTNLSADETNSSNISLPAENDTNSSENNITSQDFVSNASSDSSGNFMLNVIAGVYSLLETNWLHAEAQLNYLNSSPLTDEELKFYLNGTYLGSNYTDSEGTAEYTINITNFAPGNYSLSANYDKGNLTGITYFQINSFNYSEEENYSLESNTTESVSSDVNNSNLEINNSNSSTENDSLDVNITTIQSDAQVGEPVNWIQEVHIINRASGETDVNLSLDIPSQAGNISVADEKGKGIGLTAMKVGQASAERRGNNLGLKDRLNKGQTKIYNITYETPGPEKKEETISNGKKVRITSDLHYQNVTASVNINENLSIKSKDAIKIYWEEENKTIDFETVDKNNNGVIDGIQWTIPHLSNQTFDIIIINATKAEHLDSNRNFISDIYNEIKSLDGIWSEAINSGEYARITFERNLTSSNDITIYPRVVSGNPKIEVYEKNGSIPVAEFSGINSDILNKIYLTNLTEGQNTFDLQVVNGSVEFDYIVDPSSGWANTSFNSCRNITIRNSGASSLTNFPSYINLSYDSDMQSNYADLRFYNASCNNNGTMLNYEIENYTSTNALIWVNIPTLSTPNVTISVYYKNNTAVSSGQNATSAWNTNYVMVQHFNNLSTGAGDIKDSTGDHNGTTNGMNSSELVSGKVGNAFSFDGINDYIEIGIPSTITLGDANYTISAWIKSPSNSQTSCIFGKANAGVHESGDKSFGVDSTDHIGMDNGWVTSFFGTSDVIDNTWHYLTWVQQKDYSGGNEGWWLYVDGKLENSEATSATLSDIAGHTVRIGQGLTTNSPIFPNNFSGLIDEFTISNAVRSANWINQSYQMQGNQGSFVTVGNELLQQNFLPIVNLSYPPDNYYNDTSRYVNLTFNASVSAYAGLVNCSLWTDYSGTWAQNQTQNISGTSNVTSFNLTNLTNNIFSWNIQCFDTSGLSSFATANRTVSLNWTQPVWVDTTFNSCRDIVIKNASSSTLTNYPSYINLTNLTNMNPDLSDLRFYSKPCGNGGSSMNYEIESYDSNHADVWVLTNLSAGNITISLYYGNMTPVTSAQNTTAVWSSSDYLGVWHLANSSGSLNVNDSSSSGNNGTNNGTTSVSGKIDGAGGFDGTSDFVSLPNSFITTNNFTVSAWFKTTSYGVIFSEQSSQYPATPTVHWEPILYVETNGTFNGGVNAGAFPYLQSTSVVNDGNWHSASVWVTSSNQSLYIDGVFVKSFSGTTEGPLTYFDIGTGYTNFWPNTNNTWFFFNGSIDQVEVANGQRSAAWINQSYRMQGSQGSFVFVGNELFQQSFFPIVNLSYPSDNYYHDTFRYVNLTFNASVSAYAGLVNCSLWTDYSGTWAQNQTQSISGLGNVTSFSLTNLTNKTFSWNIQCFDNQLQSSFATANRTVSLNWTDVTPPVVTGLSAVPNPVNLSNLVNLSANVIDNYHMDTVLIGLQLPDTSQVNYTTRNSGNVYYNDSINVTQLGTYTYTIYANDSFGNQNYAQSSTFNVQDPFPPTVNLDQLPNGYYNDSVQYLNLTLNASVSDNYALQSCYLWTNLTGLWEPNQVQSVSGTANTASFNLTNMGFTAFIWNIQCFDTSGLSSFASANRTVKLNWTDRDSPIVTLIYPPESSGDNDGNIVLYYNVTDYSGVSNCSLIINNTVSDFNAYITKDQVMNFVETGLTPQRYPWSVNCTDANGNTGNSTTRNFDVILTTNFGGNTTNFTNVDTGNISNLIIDSPGIGKITYNQNVNLSGGADINGLVIISNNFISADTISEPRLNESATLSLYGLPYTFTPFILKDNSLCTSCILGSYSNGNITFNITDFTSFSTEANSNLVTWDDTDPAGGSQTKHVNDTLFFYANYTNQTSGVPIVGTGICQIRISDVTTNMTYNSTSHLYQYNASFIYPGAYNSYVTCNGTSQGYESLNTSNTFAIFSSAIRSGFNVYDGNFQFTSALGTTTTQNIGGTVDMNHSFLIMYTAGTGTPSSPSTGAAMGYISSPSQVTFVRNGSANGLYVSWFVIEALNNEFTVRGRGNITINRGAQSNTSTFSDNVTNMSQAVVVYGLHSGNSTAVADMQDVFALVNLTSNNTVLATRASAATSSKAVIRYEVVEWSSNYTIYSGQTTVNSSTVSALISGSGNPGDPVINMSRSIMLASWTAPSNGIQQVQNYYFINQSNQVVMDTYSGIYNNVVKWYVIQFPASQPAIVKRYSYNWNPGTAPNNVLVNTISPSVDPAKTFIIMSDSVLGTGTTFRRDFNLPVLINGSAWSETQYNPIANTNDQHETRASVIQLPYAETYPDNPPVVIGTYPPGNYTNNASRYVNLDFNASATDDNMLVNCSLWTNSTGTWNMNQTQNVSGKSNTTSFTLSGLTNISFIWGIQCYDNISQAGWMSTNGSVILNWTDTNPPTWSNAKTYPTSPVNYNASTKYQFNVTWQDDVGVTNVLFENNFTGALQNYSASGNNSAIYYYNYSSLAAGTYVWKSYANDTSGNINMTDQFTYVVNKATPKCTLNIFPPSPRTYNTSINASCICTNADSGGSATLYRNGTDVTSENNQVVTLAAGSYFYNCTTPATENYSYAESTTTYIINKNSSIVALLLNGTDGNFSINQHQTANITASIISPVSGSLWLYMNGNLINNGTSALQNITLFDNAGIYNMTVIYPGAQNYTSSSKTHFLIVNDTTPPNITIIYPPSASNTTDPTPLISFNATDNYDNWINYKVFADGALDQTGLAQNGTTTNISVVTQLQAGSHNVSLTLTDAAGNSVNSTTLNITVSPPIVYLGSPPLNAYISSRDVNFTFNVTDYAFSILNCSLYINSAFNQSNSSTLQGVDTTFKVYGLNESANQQWMVICANIAGTSGNDTRFFNIDLTPPTWLGNFTAPQNPATYKSGQGYEFNITWYDQSPITVLIEHNFTGALQNYTVTTQIPVTNGSAYSYDSPSLAAGTYVWKEYANDILNHSNQTSQWTYTVQKASPTCNLSIVPSSPTDYNTSINASCICSNDDLGGNATLYRNGTDVTSSENNNLVTLPAGSYFYNCTTPSTQNYTYAENTTNYIINKLQSAVTLLINGTEGNVSIEVFTYLNLTANLISPTGGHIELYNDGNLINSGTDSLENNTFFDAIGLHNITVLYPETENYSASYETFFINVTDSIPPTLNLSSPPDNYYNDVVPFVNLTFNATVSDNYALQNCSLWTNSTGTWSLNQTQNISGTNNVTSFNLTNLVNRIFIWNIQCYDTSNLSVWGAANRTVKLNWTDVLPPTINLYSPSGTTGDDTPTLNFSVSEQTYIDSVWYSVDNGNNVTIASGINIQQYNVNTIYLHLAEGNHTVSVYTNDTSGNLGSVNSNFTINMNYNYYDSFNDNSSIRNMIGTVWNPGNVSFQKTNITTGPYTPWQATTQTGDAGWQNTGRNNYSFRMIISHQYITQNGTAVRFLFSAGTQRGLRINYPTICERADSTSDCVAGTWKNLTIGGSQTYLIPLGQSNFTDWMNYTINSSKDYLISFWLNNNPAEDGPQFLTSVNGNFEYSKQNQDLSRVQNWSGYSPVSENFFYAPEVMETTSTFEANTGSFTSLEMNTTQNIYRITNITWGEAGTDTNNNVTVQVSADDGQNWYNATKGQPITGINVGNSLLYNVVFTTTGTNSIALLDMNISWNSTDDRAPTWSNNVTSIISTYSPSTVSKFNITWNDNIAVSSILFESNYSGQATNYTMGNLGSGVYNYSTILPAGIYYWKSYANDTTNNWNSTDTWNFTIAKAVGLASLYLNGSAGNMTRNVSFSADITCTLTTPSSGNITIYENGTAINSSIDSSLTTTRQYPSVGYYNITCMLIDQNYTASKTLWINATDQVNPSVANLSAAPSPVGLFNLVNLSANVTDNYQVGTVLIGLRLPNSTTINYTTSNFGNTYYNDSINVTQLGTYNYTIYANDSFNNKNYSVSANFSVQNMTAPTDILCNGNTNCNITVNNTVNLNATGSAVSDGGTIAYFIEANYTGIGEVVNSTGQNFSLPNPAIIISKVGTDTNGTSATGTQTVLNFSHTLVAGSNRMVAVGVGIENAANEIVNSVTYGNVNMTRAVSNKTGTSGTIYLAEIWYLLDSNLTAMGDGAKNVSITVTSGSTIELNAGASEYTGVNQSTPEYTAINVTTTSGVNTLRNTLSASNGAWVISAVGDGATGTFTHGSPQFTILNFQDSSSAFSIAELRNASGQTFLNSTFSATSSRMVRVLASFAKSIPTKDSNTTPFTYNNLQGNQTSISNVSVKVQVNSYDPRASVNLSTTDPDLWLEAYNGTGWVSIGAFSLASSYTGNGLNTTSANFTLTTTNAGILAGWQNSNNQDIRIKSVYMDNNGTISDQINYTNVWVDIYGKGWKPIGNHTNGSSITWNISGLPEQNGIDLRVKALDLLGGNYTNYFTKGANMVVDYAYPLISYGTGMQSDGAIVNKSYIFVNVSVVENNPVNITYYLYNSSGIVNSTTYRMANQNSNTTINWTNLLGNTYSYNVTVIDFGNQANSTATRTITLDYTSPSLIIFIPQAINYTSNQLSLNYSASDANVNSCWYSLNSGANVSLPGCQNSTFTASQGQNNLTVYANDTAGNMNSTNVSFYVDSIAPQIAFIPSTLSNGSTSGLRYIFVNISVNETNPANITYSLYNSSGTVNSTTYRMANQNSNTTINWTNLSGGIYSYNVTALDALGNSNFTETRWITLDLTSPSAVLVSPENNTYTNNATQNLTFSANDTYGIANETLRIYNSTGNLINTTNISVAGTQTTGGIIYNFPYDGNFSWSYLVYDNAGNSNLTSARILVLDTTPPTVTLYSPLNQSYSNSTIALNYSVSDLHPGSCWYSLNGGTTNTSLPGCQNSTFTVSQGQNTLILYANDSVGNTNSTNVSFFADLTSPQISYSSGTEDNNTQFERNWIYVNVSLVAPSFGNITFRLYNNSALVTNVTYSDFITSINFTDIPSSNITYYYNVTATSEFGKSNSTETRTIKLFDITPPFVQIVEPQNASYDTNLSLLLNYVASDANINSCWYRLDNGANVSLTCGQNTTFNTGDFQEHTIYLFANDTLGNFNSTNASFMINTSLVLTKDYLVSRGSFNLSSPNVALPGKVDKTKSFIMINTMGASSDPSALQVTASFTNSTNLGFYNYAPYSTFNYCRDIVIKNASSSALTNFPTYVNLTNLTNMNPDLSDLRFANTPCNSSGAALPYEIENYTSSRADVWVLTNLSTGNTTISMYYGNTTPVTSVQNASAVWGNGYVSVYHLKRSGGSLNVNDSSSNGNNGTNNGTTSVSGKIDGAGGFDGTSDYVNLTNKPAYSFSGPFTITGWIDVNSFSVAWQAVVTKGDSAWRVHRASSTNNLGFGTTGLSTVDMQSSININDGNWHYFAAVYNGTAKLIYIDGNAPDTASVTGTLSTNTYNVLIGENEQARSRYFNGTIDEIEISNTSRSAAWINQSYQMQGNQGSYVFVGNQQANPSQVSVEWKVITGPGFSVQRADQNYSASTSSVTIPISSVNLSSSFIVVQNRLNTSNASNYSQGLWMSTFVNSTAIRLQRAITGTVGTVNWQVVNLANSTVNNGTVNFATQSALSTLSNSVQTDRSFLVFSGMDPGSSLNSIFASGQLLNSTTVAIARAAAADTYNASYFVVSSNIFRVNSGLASMSSSTNVTIPALYNVSKAFSVSSQNTTGTGTNVSEGHVASKLVNTTALQLAKLVSGQTDVVSWQTIEFIERDAPIVNLIFPGNYQNFSAYNITQFNYTTIDATGVSNCSLLGNWTGAWNINQTANNPANATLLNFSRVNMTADGFYIWNVMCTDVYGNTGTNLTNYTFSTYLPPGIPSLINITQTKNDGTGSITISWNSSNHTTLYMIYAGNNISNLSYLNQTLNTNYTDPTFPGNIRRFYQVVSANPGSQNYSSQYFGAHVYTLQHTTTAKNWIGFPTNFTYLADANQTFRNINNATDLTTWNATTQTPVTCNNFSCPSAPFCTSTTCDFSIQQGNGYQVSLNSSALATVNWSGVGVTYSLTNITMIKNSTSFGKNWISMAASTSLANANGLIKSINYSDAVTSWSSSTQKSLGYLYVPSFGLYLGTNFPISLESGYEVSVTQNGTWAQV